MRDQWAWLDEPIDPCPRDLPVPFKEPKSGFWKRLFNRMTGKPLDEGKTGQS